MNKEYNDRKLGTRMHAVAVKQMRECTCKSPQTEGGIAQCKTTTAVCKAQPLIFRIISPRAVLLLIIVVAGCEVTDIEMRTPSMASMSDV
jgi:hypothetical protein